MTSAVHKRGTFLWECLGVFMLAATLATWAYSVYPLDSWRWSEPPGQGFYLISKLLGLLTVLALWWQVLSAILSHPTSSSTRLRGHKQAGVLLLAAAVLHYLSFVVAVYIRNGAFPFDLLIPTFTSFFKFSLSLGWFALLSLIVVILVALNRRRFKNLWLTVHRLAYLAIILGVLHGFLIGTETGIGPYLYLYLGLAVTVVVALILRKFGYHTLVVSPQQ